MWSTLGSWATNSVSAVGNVVIATGSLVGLGPGETPPANLPSNYPFRKNPTSDEHIQWCHDQLYKEYIRIMDGTEWTDLGFVDPEAADGGDLKLFSRPPDVGHHFMRASFTLKNARAVDVISLVASKSIEERQKFGPNMEHLEYFEELDHCTSLLYTKFWAPPPTAGRDFVFLQGRRANDDDGTLEVWGCSVQDDRYPENSTYVRGASFWGWRAKPCKEGSGKLYMSYFNASDPRGWCPSWIFNFIKTQVSNDLLAVRNIINGKASGASKINLSDIGVSPDEAQQPPAPLPQA